MARFTTCGLTFVVEPHRHGSTVKVGGQRLEADDAAKLLVQAFAAVGVALFRFAVLNAAPESAELDVIVQCDTHDAERVVFDFAVRYNPPPKDNP